MSRLEDLPDWDAICEALAQAGEAARAAGQRLTFHPSEFVKIAAPPERWVQGWGAGWSHTSIKDEVDMQWSETCFGCEWDSLRCDACQQLHTCCDHSCDFCLVSVPALPTCREDWTAQSIIELEVRSVDVLCLTYCASPI